MWWKLIDVDRAAFLNDAKWFIKHVYSWAIVVSELRYSVQAEAVWITTVSVA